MKRHSYVALAILFCNAISRANDTMAQITPLGIQFVKSNEISMLSEQLTISPAKIKVTYVFKNESEKDIDGEVTFPIPEIPILSDNGYNPEGQNGAIDTDPVKFKLIVDGKPTKYSTDFEILNIQFKDKTEKDKLHFSVADPETEKKIKISNYEMAGAAKYNYHWKQKFPAHKEVKIEHEYNSAPGSGFFDSLPKEGGKYCFDNNFLQAFNKEKSAYIKKSKSTEDHFERDRMHYLDRQISYILMTANNWKGPIQKFKLIIEKTNSKQLFQTCFEDLRKVNPMKFEVEKTNYSPKTNLDIIFVDFSLL